MSFGKNLQYFRKLSGNMTQEVLAEKLNVSRQTISKWEIDAANPEMDKALEICKIFNCSLDNLFRDEMDKQSNAYSNLRLEEVPGAYQTLGDFMRTNGLVQSAEGVIPCFETDGESMDIYIACR